MINLDDLAADRGSHSVFGPSSSAMWMGCSGSLIPNLLARDSVGREAAEGTVAHGVAEAWLKSGKKPRHLVGTTEWVEEGDWGFLIDIDEVMLDHVQRYVDWCVMLPGEHFIEQKVDFSKITPIPRQRGTADHIACMPGRLVVTDLKYGKGVPVYAEENTQGLLYALGAFYEHDIDYDFQEIVVRIAQPRLDNFDEWTISREGLLMFEQHAKERAYAAWRLDAPRSPSAKACQWCKVKATCGAVAKLQADLMAAAFDGIDAEVTSDAITAFKDDLVLTAIPKAAPLAELTVDEMATLYGFRGMVEKWWNALSAELYNRAIAGEEIPGYKLVESRSRRIFRDADVTASKLQKLGLEEDQIWSRNLLSPAQAEAALKKAGHRSKDLPDLLADLVHKPVGKPTLAPITDKRSALVDLSGLAFGDLAENSEDEES